MIYAIIDIGSNTVRLSVYRVYEDRVVNLFNEKESVGLRSYVEDGVLTDEGIENLIEILSHFKLIIDNFNDIDRVYPFATASIRLVANRKEVIDRVRDATGLEIEILSAEEEASLSFIGASSSVKIEEGVLCDIGGGSSEIVIFSQGKVVRSTSLDIGSLSAFDDYVKELILKGKEKKKISQAVEDELEGLGFAKENHDILCVVGGSGRACLKMYNKIYKLKADNDRMDSDKLKELLESLIDNDSRETFNLILKVKADRIHTLMPGMVILSTLAEYFSASTIMVSQTGVREGYIYKKILEE